MRGSSYTLSCGCMRPCTLHNSFASFDGMSFPLITLTEQIVGEPKHWVTWSHRTGFNFPFLRGKIWNLLGFIINLYNIAQWKCEASFLMCKGTINNTFLNVLLVFYNNVINTLKRKYKRNFKSSDKASETLFHLYVQSMQTWFSVHLSAYISIPV